MSSVNGVLGSWGTLRGYIVPYHRAGTSCYKLNGVNLGNRSADDGFDAVGCFSVEYYWERGRFRLNHSSIMSARQFWDGGFTNFPARFWADFGRFLGIFWDLRYVPSEEQRYNAAYIGFNAMINYIMSKDFALQAAVNKKIEKILGFFPKHVLSR